MKQILCALVMIALTGCATPLTSNTTISDDLLNSVKANGREPVSVILSSDLPDTHEVDAGGMNRISNVTATFQGMIQNYASAKFNKSDGATSSVAIRLNSFEMSTQRDESFHGIMMASSANGAEMTAKARLNATITVKRSGKADEEKKFTASVDSPYNNATTRTDIYSEAMNKACNKALIFINGYVESLGL